MLNVSGAARVSAGISPMRAARIILIAVVLVIGLAFVVPSRWLASGKEDGATASEPHDVTSWALFAVSGYFLLAARLPRLRPRLGWSDGLGAFWTRSGWQTCAQTERAPRMSGITCCGIAIGIAGMAWISGPQNIWGREMPPAVGLAVGLAGLVIAILGVFFTRGKGVSSTRNLRTGKTIRRRGYYEI